MRRSNGSPLALAISLLVILTTPSIVWGISGSDTAPYPRDFGYSPFSGSVAIDSEDDFTSENGVVSGSGTMADPFIIEEWSFGDPGTSIKIAQTTSHLIIRNVTISNGAGSGQYGIVILAAENIEIRSCSVNWSGGGIQLIGFCNNILLNGNRIENNTGSGITMRGRFENLTILQNALLSNRIDGLFVDGPAGKDILVEENSFVSNFAFGIEIIGGMCLNLSGNQIDSNGNGGILAESTLPGVEIRSNVIEDHDYYGMEIQGVNGLVIAGNDVMRSGHIGIAIASGSSGCKVIGNRLADNSEGILIGGPSGMNEIRSNVITRSNDGIVLDQSNDNTVSHNIIDNCSYSIRLFTSSDENSIAWNSIKNSTIGIMISECESDFVLRNEITSAENDAIFIRSSKGMEVEGNVLSSELRSLRIEKSEACSVISNLFKSRDSAITLWYCSALEIYDNWFISSTGSLLDYCQHIAWSLKEKEPGKNIVGGPYIKGNYWADYQGEDIDGDGIGDTHLPHGPGDAGPLVKDPPPPDTAPPIVLLADDWIHPDTYNEAHFRFRVHDNRSLFGVNVSMGWTIEDRYGGKLEERELRETILDGFGRFEDGSFIPIDAVCVNFTFSARDFAGNTREQEIWIPVRDTVDPAISLIEYEPNGWTDEDFLVTFAAEDNIALERVYARYYFDSGIYRSEEVNASAIEGSGFGYELMIDMEPCSQLHLVLRAVDTTGLVTESEWMTVSILDDVRPRAEDVTTGSPRTGEVFNMSFKLTDDVAVVGGSIDIRVDGKFWTTIDCPGLQGSLWNLTLDIGANFKKIAYELVVNDRSGNRFELIGDYHVIDIIRPSILRTGDDTPLTGKPFEVRFQCLENHAFSHGSVEWWIDDGEHTIAEEIPHITTIPTIAPEAEVLHIRASVTDQSGNVGIFETDLDIGDGTPPSIFLEYDDPLTSHLWNLSAISFDRFGVDKTWIEYSIDGGPYTTGGSKISFDVPETAATITIVARSHDTSGLKTNLTRAIPVGDGSPPRIVSHWAKSAGGGKMAFMVEATDNREGHLSAFLILDDRDPIPMEEKGSGRFYLAFKADDLEGVKSFRFKITDEAGLSTVTEGANIVLDTKIPWVLISIALTVIAIVCVAATVIGIRWHRAISGEE